MNTIIHQESSPLRPSAAFPAQVVGFFIPLSYRVNKGLHAPEAIRSVGRCKFDSAHKNNLHFFTKGITGNQTGNEGIFA